MERSYKFDNLKAFLIFCVVLCHFCELFGGMLKYRLYMVIYTFHMPLFVFLSGYFAKFSIKNILCKQVYPYVLFQILYCWFTNSRIQFGTPHWILWYIFALAVWNFSLCIVKKGLPFWITAAVFLTLIAGFFPNIHQEFAASRVLFFYPFFLLGFWCKQKNKMEKLHLSPLSGMAALVCALVLSLLCIPHIKTNWLYHSYPYAESGASLWWRLSLILLALIWIFALVVLAPERKIPVFSEIGRYSVCVYLLHGFVRYLFSMYGTPFVFDDSANLFLAALISAFLCVLLGNRYAFYLLKPIFVLSLPHVDLYKRKKM